jgi:hypothetical protein
MEAIIIGILTVPSLALLAALIVARRKGLIDG